MRHVLPCLLAAALASGCAGSYDYDYGYTSYYSTPDLAYVGNGVYAVTDWNEPVFYADDYYWRYNSGLWYRSPFYYGDWQYYAHPPRAVLQIDRPYNYVRYRPYPRGDYRYRSDYRYRGHDNYRHPDRRYRDSRGQPVYRDNRAYRDPRSVPRAQGPRAVPRSGYTPQQRPVMERPRAAPRTNTAPRTHAPPPRTHAPPPRAHSPAPRSPSSAHPTGRPSPSHGGHRR